MQKDIIFDLSMRQELLDSLKSFYLVYDAYNDDFFDYNEENILYKSTTLDQVHNFAYKEWQKDRTKFFTIIQAYDGSCRGGYGFSEGQEEIKI